MNFLTTNRLRTALVAAVAAAFFLPAAAHASSRHYHHIGYYKVEKHLTMISDDQSVELACKDTDDYAADGMWRIDHVDQDDDELTFPGPWVSTADYGEAVQVLSAYNEGFTTAFGLVGSDDPDKYQFHFQKNAVGTAQLKVWITCIEGATNLNKVGGHQHAITLSGSGNTTANDAGTPGTITVNSTPCASNTDTVISPSFYWSAGDGRVTKSILADITNTSDMDEWTWKFSVANSIGSAAVKVGWSCIERQIGPAPTPVGTHHRLIRKLVVGPVADADDPTNPTSIPSGTQAAPYTETRVNCSAHYKGLVGGFDATSHASLYFLGMDPRIKSRAFRFLNYSGAGKAVTTMLICFNDRTSLNLKTS